MPRNLLANAPDEIGFFADIYWIIIPKYIDLLLMSHLKSSYTHMQAIILDSLYMICKIFSDAVFLLSYFTLFYPGLPYFPEIYHGIV